MRYLLILLTLLLAANGAHAAEIRLKDGSVVVGTILSLVDGEDLIVDTEYMDEVTIEWDAIAGISGTQIVDVEFFDGRRILGTVTFDDYGVSIEGEDTVSVDPTQVFAIEEYNETFWEAVDAYTDLGMNIVRGNNQVTQISFGGGIGFDAKDFELSLDVTSITNEQTNSTDTRRETLNANYTHKFENRWRGFALYQFEADEQQNLDGRSLLGAAIGRQLTNSRRQRFDLAVGLALNSEKFSGIESPEVPGETFTQRTESLEGLVNAAYRLRWKADLDLSYTILPSLEKSNRYRTQFDATLSFDVLGDLDFKVVAYDRYDSQPPAGNDKNDSGVTLALSWDY